MAQSAIISESILSRQVHPDQLRPDSSGLTSQPTQSLNIFETHFRSARLIGVEGQTCTIEAKNDLSRQWLAARLTDLTASCLAQVIS